MNVSSRSLSRVLVRIRRYAVGKRKRRLLPAEPVSRASCDGQSRIRVASYNVHKCIGVDGTFDPMRTIGVIAELDADIVALQEADKRLGSREGRLNLAVLERETGLKLVPLAARPGSHGWHGNALLVRCGIAHHIERIVLPHAEPRGAVLAEFELPSARLRVIAAHLGLLSQNRRQQLARLAGLVAMREPMPTLLMGDFNEWRPNRVRSTFTCLEPLFGPIDSNYASFPSRRPVFPLDRIFGWPTGILSDFRVHDTPLARRASDHLPVSAAIDLTAGAFGADTGEDGADAPVRQLQATMAAARSSTARPTPLNTVMSASH